MAEIASLTTFQSAAGTCTLRLTGQLLALSQQSDRPVLVRSRFHLQLWPSEPAATPADDQEPLSNQSPWLEISGREPQLQELSHLVQNYVQRYLNGSTFAPPQGAAMTLGETSLQPVGLTRHRLTLAPEPPSTSPAAMELSTLQLADLAEVLEQVDRAVHLVGERDLPRPRLTRSRVPLWLGSAAAVLVAAGLGHQWLPNPNIPLVGPVAETATEPGLDPQTTIPESIPESIPEQGASGSAPSATPDFAGPEQPPQTLERSAPNSSLPSATDQVTPGIPKQTAEGLSAPVTPAPAPGGRGAQEPPAAAPAESAPDDAPAALSGADTQPRSGNSQAPAPASIDQPQAPSPNGDPERRADPMATAAAPLGALTSVRLEALTRFLEQRWSPPPNLKGSLRYELTLQPSGEVTGLVSLSELSRNYENNPTLPQAGTLIPNARGDEAITVEVQFLPSGEVVVTPEAN
ncbi:MAG: DUF4335 domain-containing protein [Nodosilinea sp.]